MFQGTAKRRKLDDGNGVDASRSSGFSTTTAGPGAFVLETEELLKEVEFNYTEPSNHADPILRDFKETIEALEPHEPLPVSLVPG